MSGRIGMGLRAGIAAAFVAFAAACAGRAAEAAYTEDWASLNARPCPEWWRDAKFGIFIHWGLYSVPAFAPTDAKSVYDCYAEHYWRFLRKGVPAFVAYHRQHYGERPYEDFTNGFTAAEWRPRDWAELFRRAGARYVVLTSKHHEGFALWPSRYSPGWNAVAAGPHRDICGELTDAVKAAGLHMGFYYSLLEWNNPLYRPETIGRFVAEMNLPQMKELVTRYRPDILWVDGEWDYPEKVHRGAEMLAWLYNESPVKGTIVVNDRWGKGFRGKCGDHWTTEYGHGEGTDLANAEMRHPFEECRGMGRSFGYNQFETERHYMPVEKCVELLCALVSRGGNLLLNIGPDAKGNIPGPLRARLLGIGGWLAANGEAIYGTREWDARPSAADMARERVYYTRKGAVVYAIVFGARTDLLVPGAQGVKAVSRLDGARVEWCAAEGGVRLKLSPSTGSFATVYRLVLSRAASPLSSMVAVATGSIGVLETYATSSYLQNSKAPSSESK